MIQSCRLLTFVTFALLMGGLLFSPVCSSLIVAQEKPLVPAAQKEAPQAKPAAKGEAVAKEADPQVAEAEVEEADGAEQKKDAEDGKKKGANAIGNLIRGLFGGRKPQPQNDDEAGAATTEEDGKAGDEDETPKQLDDNLNSLSEVTRHLRRVELAIPMKRWPEVVKGLMDVIELPEDTFTRSSGDDHWMSAKTRAEQMFAALPPEGLRAYQASYGDLAADQLEQATRNHDFDGVTRVAERYFQTPAGQTAALALAETLLDRGEFSGAVRWLSQLDEVESPALDDLTLRVNYAYALVQSGQGRQARRVLDDIEDMRPYLGGPAIEAPVSPRDWIMALEKSAFQQTPAVADWTNPLGSATHHAVAIGDEPLLLERWQEPLTNLSSVAEQVDSLITDLSDAGRVCLPASSPVLVNGIIAVRTFSGVMAQELSTGKVLWRTNEAGSPEMLLTSGTTQQSGNQQYKLQMIMQSRYGGHGDFDNHPLTNWLFNDAVSGTLTSDGKSVFVLEKNAVFGRQHYNYGFMNGQNAQMDPFDRDWASNQIVAYDLKHGRPQWSVGGQLMNEPFDPQLAGVYFLGPPVASGSELFVIGEKDNAIALYVLDAATGNSLWTQTLANSSTDIRLDHVRRAWSCSPAVGDGIVVCPTGSGWIATVDISKRRLLWAHRYTLPKDKNYRSWGGMMVNQPLSLNSRWEVAPPVLVQNRILYTPPDLPDPYRGQNPPLLCLNATTGEKEWERNKEEDLFLAGVVQSHVLVVGKQQIRSVSLQDGTIEWTYSLPDNTRPTGHGLVVQENYFQPLSNGDVISLVAADGTLGTRFSLPTGQRPLGNLLAHQGAFVSVDAEGLRCFEQRLTIESQIATRRQQDPNDLWGLIKEAQIHLLRNEPMAAITLLNTWKADVTAGDAAKPDPQLVQLRNSVLHRGLLAVVSSDLKGHDAEFAQLQSLPGMSDHIDSIRIAIDRALVRGQHQEAFRLLWELRGQGNPSEMLEFEHLKIRQDVWLSGRLQGLYTMANEVDRIELTRQFQLAAKAAVDSKNFVEQHGLERLLAFHPVGWRLSHDLAKQAATAGDFAGAEIRWRQLLLVSDRELVAEVTLKLSELLATQGQPDEAIYLLSRGVASNGDVMIEEGVTLATRSAEYQKIWSQALTAKRDQSQPTWGPGPFTLEAHRSHRQQREQLNVAAMGDESPFYRAHRFTLDRQTQRLRIQNIDSNNEYWSVPLRASQRGMFDDRSMSIRTNGTQAIVMSRDIVHALSLSDRRVLWTLPIELRASSSMYVRNAVQQNGDQYQMQAASQFLNRQSLATVGMYSSGMLAAVTPRAVVVHGRQEFSALDPLTGEVLWTRQHVPQNTMVYGDGDQLFVVPGIEEKPYVLSILDGQSVESDTFVDYARKSLRIGDGQLLTVAETSRRSLFGLGRQSVELKSLSLADGTPSWSASLDGRSLLQWTSPNEIAALSPEGELQVINTLTGHSTKMGKLPSALMEGQQSIQLLADDQSIFLLIDDGRNRNHSYYQANFPSLRMNGVVACFDRATSNFLWQADVGSQSVVPLSSGTMPGLLMTNMRHTSDDGVSIMYVQVKLLDRKTGKPLVDSGDVVSQSHFSHFHLDLAKPELTISASNLHFRIQPASTENRVIEESAKVDAPEKEAAKADAATASAPAEGATSPSP
ncbi:MAG: PQQ-binding-like beta-propeller repeat protein [Planctomycetaceae bacterium]